MSKFGLNSFVKLTDLLSERPQRVATVSAVNSDGTVTVIHRGGGVARLRAAQTYVAGDNVLVKGEVAVSKAPNLPSSNVSI